MFSPFSSLLLPSRTPLSHVQVSRDIRYTVAQHAPHNMSDDRQVFHTPSRDEYRQYTALVRDLEVRAALDTSQLANVPRFGQAGPSDWQGEGELSSASSQATAPTRKRRRDTRWPAPRHKLQDTLFNVPNYLHEALEAYATSRIYLHGLVYPTDSDDPVDIQHLLETQLPPGVEDETMRVLNATLQDLAALRPATYKNERADQEDMPWETILHVAGPHCPPK